MSIFFCAGMFPLIKKNDPGTYMVFGCLIVPLLLWFFLLRKLRDVEQAAEGIQITHRGRGEFVPFEHITEIAIGSVFDFKIFFKRFPLVTVSYKDENGKSASLLFYGTSYDDVGDYLYREWKRVKIGEAQASIRRRSGRRR